MQEFFLIQVHLMAIIKLSNNDVEHLSQYYSDLKYDEEKNTVEGILPFNLIFDKVGVNIEDEYKIKIDLNNVCDLGIPIVREIDGKILNFAKEKEMQYADLHLNNTEGAMCIIIPPKIKERYPNGFDLIELLKHIQEHLYWISYYVKYNKAPWKDQGHGDYGYLELYLENKVKYGEEVKQYFGNIPRAAFRKKIKELIKKHKS